MPTIDMYKLTPECVFPKWCRCEDCSTGLLWGNKRTAYAVDTQVYQHFLGNELIFDELFEDILKEKERGLEAEGGSGE